jgi:hypothetical protein
MRAMGNETVSELGLAEQGKVLAGEGDRVLSLADGIVTKFVLDRTIAGTCIAAKIAVEALVMAGWNGQIKGDLAVGGRKEVAELNRIRRCVAVGQVEDEAVGKDSGCEAEDGETVAERLGIEGEVEKSPRVLAQIGVQEPQGIFEIPALRLKMVRPEVHAFRPDDPGQELHSRVTTMGEG